MAGFMNNADLDKKVATLATKPELKAEQDKKQNYKHLIHLIQIIFLIKVILKIMALKIS